MKLWKILLPVSISVLGASSAYAASCLGSNATANCINFPSGGASCQGTNAAEVIICLSAPCVVSSGGGDDIVIGSSGNDKICLGANGEKVSESLAGNDINLGTGNLSGEEENYVLSGGSGNDVNSITQPNDESDETNALLGGAGSDVNRGSEDTDDTDICSSGDVNVNCEITVTN